MSLKMFLINEAAAFGSFVVFHLLPGTRLREAIVGRIGRTPWLWVFSLVSLAQFGWMGHAYGALRHSGIDPVFWDVHPVTRYVQIGLQFIAFLFAVIGLAGDGSKARWPGSLIDADAARGMRRITRHPFLWGAWMWAVGHLLVNGDAASLIAFSAILVLSLAGMVRIDERHRRTLGPAWTAFAARTSLVPFVAIAEGRQSLRIGEIGPWRFALAIVAWAAILLAHPYIIGVRALP